MSWKGYQRKEAFADWQRPDYVNDSDCKDIGDRIAAQRNSFAVAIDCQIIRAAAMATRISTTIFALPKANGSIGNHQEGQKA
jgi:hypothetical protein